MNPKSDKPIPAAKEILKELRENPEVALYLARYDDKSAERFLRSYAKEVHEVLKRVPVLSDFKKERPLQFINVAENLFWEIQQKKLFNLQCRWRAEDITLPGIESTADFLYWEDHIEACPFLSPVTWDEYELYLEYLSGAGPLEEYPVDGYQDYEIWKHQMVMSEGESSMPEWYAFYDLRRGGSLFMILPDIRGEKELVYLELAREELAEKQKEHEAENAAKGKVPDQRPPLRGTHAEMLEFAGRFDTPESVRYLSQSQKRQEQYADHEELWAAFELLTSVNERIEPELHDDWREQILRTAYAYKRARVAEAMDPVYAGYRMRLETGLGYPLQKKSTHPDGTDEFNMDCVSRHRKDMILRGRVLNGEPADWNF